MDTSKNNTAYDRLIAKGENLIAQLDFAKNFYQQLTEHIRSESKDTVNYNHIITIFFNVINKTIGASPYYLQRELQIAHEWSLELYWIILDSMNATRVPFPNLTLAQIYNQRTGLNFNAKSNANRFAEKKKLISNEMAPANLFGDLYNEKYQPYRNLFKTLAQNTLKEGGLDALDYYFYVQNHHASPFSCKALSDGVIFTNFHQLVTDYISLYQKKSLQSFDAELSAFVFEKLYYGISYEKCMLSFFKYNSSEEITPNVFFPLSFFYDLFDTHSLSLIEHTLQSYDTQLSSFWDIDSGEKVRHDTYLMFHIYNSYWLPLFFYILAITIHNYFKKDIKIIFKELRDYIESNMNTGNIMTYRKELLKTHEEIQELTDKLGAKNNWLFPSAKNDRKEYIFSVSFFHGFFTHKPHDFILQYTCPKVHPDNTFYQISPTKLIEELEFRYTFKKNNLLESVKLFL